MGKEKKRNIDDKKEETLFYHELIGVIFIIFSISILGKLGKIGTFLTDIFKVVFGDWYWIFILFLLFYGMVSLFKHKSFDFKNQRFIGFVFICFGLLMFAHFPLHKYISEKSNSYFSETWKLYRTYLDTNANMYLGGGLIGAVMFYIVYYLFSSVGVVLIAILIMLLGVSLIIKTPIIDMFKVLINNTKKLGKFTGNFNRFFKYRLGTAEEKKELKKNVFSKSQQVSIKLLEDSPNVLNYNFQEKLCQETKSLIHSVFNNLHIEYKEIDYIISYRVTTYKYIIFSEFKINMLIDRLNNIIEEDILIGQDGNNLIIQVVNKYSQILTIKETLLKQDNIYDNYILPIGLTYENKICEIDLIRDGNILLVGSLNSGLKNFINYFIFSLMIKINLLSFEIEIFDYNNDFKELEDIIEVKNDPINDLLNETITLIDQKLEIINNSKTTSIDEYNKKVEIDNLNIEKMKRKYIIVNNIELNKEAYSYFENKLMYITQLGLKAGVNILYLVREEKYYTSIISSLFTNKLIFKLDSSVFSNKILNNDNASILKANGDSFYLSQIRARRIQTPLISKKEINNIKSSFKN